MGEAATKREMCDDEFDPHFFMFGILQSFLQITTIEKLPTHGITLVEW